MVASSRAVLQAWRNTPLAHSVVFYEDGLLQFANLPRLPLLLVTGIHGVKAVGCVLEPLLVLWKRAFRSSDS